jgi:flagellar biosynthesis/type III secretory pathway chaperone
MNSTTTPFSAAERDPLVELLRLELQEYGGLFNLLGRQQDRIINRQPDAILVLNDEIDAQTQTVADLRVRRENMVAELHGRAGASGSVTLRSIIPFFTAEVQPLLEALMNDINHMLRRNRQKARQNHLLLARAMELTEQTLRVLQPENFTRTYQRSGKVATPRPAATASRYHAVG